ncbi:cytochrome P450 2U1-like [Haliotis rubra]|uniref:cytochrome P450 2U1-like n=1 Tax=Haliotis rubra TaxID=36100 RepID=UPI001EE537AB|nr:cytochrome P450 2U1-like [Haliotis rubra]
MDMLCEGKGIVGTSGELWKDQRKFAVNTLRELGMASSAAEEKIHQELNFLLKAFEDEGSKDFDCKHLILNAMCNIICGLCFGKRQYEYNDPRFIKLIGAVEMMASDMGNSNMVDLFPAVRLLPGDFFNYKRLVKNVTVLKKEVARHAEDRVNNFDADNVEDFATAFLKEVRGSKQEGKAFDESHLHMILTDFFAPGTFDVGNSLNWSLLYLLHYPEVQEKCFQLIKEHIGLERLPTMMDKPNLPYVEAVYAEVLRHADAVPTGMPYTVPHNVQFMGYTIPEGVTILPVLNSVLHDPVAWGDLRNFRPDRFLNDEGKFQKREEFVPFSLGRRACLGQSLVRMEQFLILTTLIQRFKLVPPSGTLAPLTGIMGLAHTAPHFKCKVIPRNI